MRLYAFVHQGLSQAQGFAGDEGPFSCDVHVLVTPWALGGCVGVCLRVHVWEDVISQ